MVHALFFISERKIDRVSKTRQGQKKENKQKGRMCEFYLSKRFLNNQNRTNVVDINSRKKMQD